MQQRSLTKPYVDAFALEMERRLAANRHKDDNQDAVPGWVWGESIDWLVAKMLRCCGALAFRVAEGEDVVAAAADVANYAMMIANREGLGPIKRGQIPPDETEVREIADRVRGFAGAPMSDDFARELALLVIETRTATASPLPPPPESAPPAGGMADYVNAFLPITAVTEAVRGVTNAARHDVTAMAAAIENLAAASGCPVTSGFAGLIAIIFAEPKRQNATDDRAK